MMPVTAALLATEMMTVQMDSDVTSVAANTAALSNATITVFLHLPTGNV
jgi:hypothetical protein